MKKQQLKVGDLVKDKWGASSKVDEWKKKTFNVDIDIFIPPMGIIKKIKTVTKHKTQVVDGQKTKVAYKVEVAEIDWTTVTIPALKAETNKWELDHYNKYRLEMDINHIVLYENYYKSLLKRKAKKNT